MLSHEYKCIFVHVPKVAGQSIEHVLLDLHGLTWDERAPLLLRQNSDASLGPPRLAHLKASEYVSCGYITQKLFDSYFKFAFVRNPWSRLVSIYKYMGYSEDMPFKKFVFDEILEKGCGANRWFIEPQHEYVFNDKGEQLVDFIGRFEDLQGGFDFVCNQLKIAPTTLPHVNHTFSDKSLMLSLKGFVKSISPIHKKYDLPGHYSEYYDSETRDLMNRLYAKDIDAFGYVFNER